MSQYRLFRHLAAVATFGAFAATGCFVVDDTDDDDEGSEDTGGSGGTRGGTGGTRPSGGASTGGASTGGSGGECVPANGTCVDPLDCCNVQMETGYCVEGTCADACTTDAQCTSNCCFPLQGGGMACAPAALCEEPPPGDATMKFCNDLARGDESVTLTVEFAGVSATAASGECTPVVPNACIAIPTGTNPSVALMEGTTEIITGSFPTLTVVDGDEMLVLAAIDDATGNPSVFAETFAELYGTACADTDPITAPPLPLETRSAPFDLPSSQRKLRNVFSPSVSRETKSSLGASWLRR